MSKQVVVVDIASNGSDKALFVNGQFVISADPQAGDDPSIIDETAQSLAAILGVEIEKYDFDPGDKWQWSEIEARLRADGILSNTSAPQAGSKPAGSGTEVQFHAVDWRIVSREPIDKFEDARPFQLKAKMGNQSRIELHDTDGTLALSLHIEIDKGAPAVRFENEDATLMHVYAVDGALVVTPENSSAGFEAAPVNRYTFDDRQSLLVG